MRGSLVGPVAVVRVRDIIIAPFLCLDAPVPSSFKIEKSLKIACRTVKIAKKKIDWSPRNGYKIKKNKNA